MNHRIAIATILVTGALTGQGPGSPTRVPTGTQHAVRKVTQLNSEVQAVVRLTDAPLALLVGPNAKRTGPRLTADQQRAYLQTLAQKQNTVANQVAAMGGRELGRVSKLHNALIVSIPSAQLNRLAGDTASPSQTGLLLLYGDAKTGKEAEIVTVTP